MKNNANTLIKKKNLVFKLKERGIRRINPEAELLLERWLEQNLNKIVDALRDEITIHGRKTLKKADVQQVLKKIRSKEEFWEI